MRRCSKSEPKNIPSEPIQELLQLTIKNGIIALSELGNRVSPQKGQKLISYFFDMIEELSILIVPL